MNWAPAMNMSPKTRKRFRTDKTLRSHSKNPFGIMARKSSTSKASGAKWVGNSGYSTGVTHVGGRRSAHPDGTTAQTTHTHITGIKRRDGVERKEKA